MINWSIDLDLANDDVNIVIGAFKRARDNEASNQSLSFIQSCSRLLIVNLSHESCRAVSTLYLMYSY